MIETAEHVLDLIIHCGVLALEIVGAALILYRSALAVISLFRKKGAGCHKCLTEGITTGLSFLLASEVLKTIIDQDWTFIGMTCAILLMRAAISILVHWESRTKEAAEERRER